MFYFYSFILYYLLEERTGANSHQLETDASKVQGLGWIREVDYGVHFVKIYIFVVYG